MCCRGPITFLEACDTPVKTLLPRAKAVHRRAIGGLERHCDWLRASSQTRNLAMSNTQRGS